MNSNNPPSQSNSVRNSRSSRQSSNPLIDNILSTAQPNHILMPNNHHHRRHRQARKPNHGFQMLHHNH